MNQELIDMANKTLELMPPDSHCRELYWSATDEELEAFAALVAAAEREKVAKQWEQWYGFDLYGVGSFIRARGETK